MNFDQIEWMKRLKQDARAKQEELKVLSDDELMQMDDALYDSAESFEKVGSALLMAVRNEVERRSWSACWFWRRWWKPEKCDKWLGHRRNHEEKAKRLAMKLLSNQE